METGNLEFILAWASVLGAVLAAFGFLHREMRRGFDSVDKKFARVDERFARVDERFARVDERFARVDERFDRVDERFDGQDEKFEGLRALVTGVQVSVARIEGHLGIGFPAAGEPRAADDPPERAA